MTHGPEHHLEEAEHAQHAAHNPFDRRVTLTMAIVAALLACVTLLSHRAHNLTLQNQIKSNDNITERANVFARYQAKKNRQLLDEALAEFLGVMVPDSAPAPTKEKAKTVGDKWNANARKWKGDAKKIEAEGKALGEDIQKYAEEAHKYHFRADFFDYGELGIQFALILCTISLLIKSRAFWFTGMAAAALGFAVAMAGFLVPPPHHEHTKEKEEVGWLFPREESLASGTAATSLDERVGAESDKRGAQHSHRNEARAADALHLARRDEPASRGEEAE
jgi:hypothetical protein